MRASLRRWLDAAREDLSASLLGAATSLGSLVAVALVLGYLGSRSALREHVMHLSELPRVVIDAGRVALVLGYLAFSLCLFFAGLVPLALGDARVRVRRALAQLDAACLCCGLDRTAVAAPSCSRCGADFASTHAADEWEPVDATTAGTWATALLGASIALFGVFLVVWAADSSLMASRTPGPNLPTAPVFALFVYVGARLLRVAYRNRTRTPRRTWRLDPRHVCFDTKHPYAASLEIDEDSALVCGIARVPKGVAPELPFTQQTELVGEDFARLVRALATVFDRFDLTVRHYYTHAQRYALDSAPSVVSPYRSPLALARVTEYAEIRCDVVAPSPEAANAARAALRCGHAGAGHFARTFGAQWGECIDLAALRAALRDDPVLRERVLAFGGPAADASDQAIRSALYALRWSTHRRRPGISPPPAPFGELRSPA